MRPRRSIHSIARSAAELGDAHVPVSVKALDALVRCSGHRVVGDKAIVEHRLAGCAFPQPVHHPGERVRIHAVIVAQRRRGSRGGFAPAPERPKHRAHQTLRASLSLGAVVLDGACAVGFYGGQYPGLADSVTGTGPTDEGDRRRRVLMLAILFDGPGAFPGG